MYSIKKVFLIITIMTIFSGIFIGTIFYFELGKNSEEKLPDANTNLLIGYSKQMDWNEYNGEEITSVATSYSVLYKNKNRRTMYVSSVPIRNENNGDYIFIDKNLKIGDGYFYTQYDDRVVVYSNTGIMLQCRDELFHLSIPNVVTLEYCENVNSIYGNYDGVKFFLENGIVIYAVPSYNGVVVTYTVEENYTEISFPVIAKKYRISNDYYGSILFSDKSFSTDNVMQNNYYTISQPIVLKSNGMTEVQNIASIRENRLVFSSSETIEYPISLTFSISFYCENMFFDCATFKQDPKSNYIFDNYIVYELSKKNETSNYMKFNIRSFTPSNKRLLDSIVLNLYVLYYSGDVVLEVYSVRNDWCSWTLTWKNQPAHNEKIGEFKVSGIGWHSIDLTNYVKLLIENNYYSLQNNSILFKIKDGSSGYAIFTSTDNGVIPPYFKVYYRVEE